MTFKTGEWLEWFSQFKVECIRQPEKIRYFHAETDRERPIAEFCEAKQETVLFRRLEFAIRSEILKRQWCLSLDVYPGFSGATIIAHIDRPREIAFKRSTETYPTLIALCLPLEKRWVHKVKHPKGLFIHELPVRSTKDCKTSSVNFSFISRKVRWQSTVQI